MKKMQYWMIALPSALALVAVLYFLPNKKNASTTQHKEGVFDISTFEAEALQTLKESEQQFVTNIAKDTASKASAFEQLEEFWSSRDTLSNPLLVVYYTYRRLLKFPTQDNYALIQKARFINLLAFETQDAHIHNTLLDWALGLMLKAQTFFPDNDSLQVDLAASRLWYAPEEGRELTPPMQSIAQIKSIVEKNPKQTYALYVLGMASLMSGQMEKAVGYFERVTKILPNDQNAIRALQSTYTQLGDKEKAAYWAKKVK